MEYTELKCVKHGQHLIDFALEPIKVANKTGKMVIADFNEAKIFVEPGDTPQLVVDKYLSLIQH